MAGPWDKYQAAPAAPPAMTGPPSVIEGPDRLPTPQTPAQAQGDVLANTKAGIAISQAPLEARKLQADTDKAEADAKKAQQEQEAAARKQDARRADSLENARNVFKAGAGAKLNMGWSSTGLSGKFLGNYEGYAGRALRGYLDTIKGNLAFSNLQTMRENSPTGAAVGNVSDTDMRLLASTVASLDPGLDEKTLTQNVNDVMDHYTRFLRRLGYSDDDIAHADPFGHQDNPPPKEKDKAVAAAALPTPGTPIDSTHPLDPTGSGDIGFASKASDEANSLPAGSQEFQRDLSYKIANGQLSTPEQIVAFGAESKLNEGRGFVISPEQAKAVIDSVHKGGTFNIDTPQFPKPDISDVRGEDTAGERGRAFVRGIPAAVGLDDELNAALDGGNYREALARERAIRDYDEENHFWSRLGGQTVGGMAAAYAVPGSAAASARAAGTAALRQGLGREAAEAAARRAVVGRFGLEGGVLGGAYGIGNSDGSVGDRLVGGLVGGAEGAAVGAALPVLARGASMGARYVRGLRTGAGGSPMPPGGQDAIDIARAADAEAVPISRPIVDPSVRDRMAYLESSIGSGNVVRRGLEDTRQGIEDRVGELGFGGTAEPSSTLGLRVQNAGQRFIDRSRSTGQKLYDRAAQMAGSNPIQARNAVDAIDANIAELSQNPNTNGPLIKYMQELRSDFVDADGNLLAKNVGSIRDLRTAMRGQISQRNLTMTDAERRVGQVLDAAKTDIQRDLGQSAPAAVRQYDRADQFWRQRQDEIGQVVQRFIGPRNNPFSPEKVMSTLQSMAGPRGDVRGLERMFTKFEPQERMDIAASIAESLGRRSPDEPFSAANFLNSTRALSPRARTLIFGQDGAQSIENLRRLSQAYKDTAGRLNNSRSGVVANWGNLLRNFIGGGTLGAVVGVNTGTAAGVATGAAASAIETGLRNLSARALMNPNMSRWLAQAPRQTTASAITRHIAQLSTIAARNPSISGTILPLHQKLMAAVNDNVGMALPAVADPQQEGADERK